LAHIGDWSRARVITSSLACSILVVILVMGMVACGGGGASPSGGPTSRAPSGGPTSTASDPFANPAITGKFRISDGRMVALECWGAGSPTIILEPGDQDAGLARFTRSPLATILVTQTRVCAYDRPGLGQSDAAPVRPRDADDAVRDLDGVLTAAKVGEPYLLVGSSFGGFIAMFYASSHPEKVAGVVLLDVPPPPKTPDPAGPPAWDAPDNREHFNFLAGFDARINKAGVPIKAPLTVVTASQGQSDQKDQSRWLKFSSDADAVLLEGGHVIYRDNPDGVANVIKAMLKRIKG
jgi:surfactin synthase thioesterase subunit